MDPINKDGLEVTRLTSSTSDDAEWVGGFFAHGGDGAESSTVIWFAMEDLEVIGFFSASAVEQHWTEEVWQPGDLRVTGSPTD